MELAKLRRRLGLKVFRGTIRPSRCSERPALMVDRYEGYVRKGGGSWRERWKLSDIDGGLNDRCQDLAVIGPNEV